LPPSSLYKSRTLARAILVHVPPRLGSSFITFFFLWLHFTIDNYLDWNTINMDCEDVFTNRRVLITVISFSSIKKQVHLWGTSMILSKKPKPKNKQINNFKIQKSFKIDFYIIKMPKVERENQI
jgi:hypothetical protein